MVSAEYAQWCEDDAYRIYITDCLQLIAENTAKQVGGSYKTQRFYEIVYTPHTIDTRSAEDIIADVCKRAGIKVI